jgi:O-antigen/teichoic acid export membrane protein
LKYNPFSISTRPNTSSFSTNVLVTLFGAGVSRAIILLSMVLVFRLYPAEAYGSWVIVLSLASFVMPLATLRYDLAMVLSVSRRMSAGIGLAVMSLASVLALLVFLALEFLPLNQLSVLSGMNESQLPLLMLVPLVILLLAATSVLQAWSNRERNFHAISVSQILQALVTSGLTIGLPFVFGPLAWVAALSALMGMMAAVGVLVFQSWSVLKGILERDFIVRAAGHGIRRFRVYAMFGVPYAASAVFSERLIQLLITSYYGLATLASFFVMRQIIMGPTAIIAGSLRQVVFSYGARQDNIDMLRRRVIAILIALMSVVGPLFAFGLVCIKPLINLLMGTKWPYLADFSYWTLFPASMLVLTGWIDRVLDILQKQKLALWTQMISDFALVGMATFGAFYGLHPAPLVGLLSITISFYNFAWLILALRLLHVGSDATWALAKQFFVTFVFWSIVQQSVSYFTPIGLSLIISTIVGILSLLPAIAQIRNIRLTGLV